MSHIPMFAVQYQQLLEEILSDGVEERNARTGRVVKIYPRMRSIHVDLGDGIVPTCGVRKTHPRVAAAENAWCLLGHDHIDWLRTHTSAWNEFAETNGALREAYGYRWKVAFGRDQLGHGMEALYTNPSDRRVWISSWDPRVDGLGAIQQKTVPCPVGFTLQVLDKKLQSTYVLRSSDTFLGLPHDVMRHAYLMSAVAQSLQVGLGVMSFAIANSHLYDVHFELANEALTQTLVVPYLELPRFTVEDIVADPDMYVKHVSFVSTNLEWPEWNPKPELVK